MIVRNDGTTLRDSIIIASDPSRNRVSKSADSASSSVGVTPCTPRRSRNAWIGRIASRLPIVNRVGRSGSSTMSPPLDQTNGATLMISTSVPRPYTSISPSPSVSSVSAVAAVTMSFHFQPSAGGGSTPAASNRSRL